MRVEHVEHQEHQDKSQNHSELRFWAIIAVIAGAALLRILPHPANFSPIAAMALFGGCYLQRRALAIAIPLAAMIVSDLVLGFHSTLPAVYLSFALVSLLGLGLGKKLTVGRLGLATISGSMIFFVITNFAVFLQTDLYPQSGSGLVACFVAALPFLQNSIAGDLLYTGAFFGAWALLEQAVPRLKAA